MNVALKMPRCLLISGLESGGNTPLITAASKGFKECVKILLEAGAVATPWGRHL